jgi:hypothetical protein
VKHPELLTSRTVVKFSSFDLLGLAWLCENAACWQRAHGNPNWAEQLFLDAARLRSLAVNS